jgi:hypothetical protein
MMKLLRCLNGSAGDGGHALPSDCMAAVRRKCSGQRCRADAAGGVQREQTTDENGAEQPGHRRSYEIEID